MSNEWSINYKISIKWWKRPLYWAYTEVKMKGYIGFKVRRDGIPSCHAGLQRDFWNRGECYLDGPESSLEYWKQEREKSQWETVLVRLNTITSRQSSTHTHQGRELPNYFHLPDIVTRPEPLWLEKIYHTIQKTFTMINGLSLSVQ